MEYQQIAAAWFCPCPVRMCCSLVEQGVLERWGRDAGGLVFGTLLGPETTGPGIEKFPGLVFLVSRLQRACTVWVCGVCGTGLLFENYIVDASIFYKKQFPRI